MYCGKSSYRVKVYSYYLPNTIRFQVRYTKAAYFRVEAILAEQLENQSVALQNLHKIGVML